MIYSGYRTLFEYVAYNNIPDGDHRFITVLNEQGTYIDVEFINVYGNTTYVTDQLLGNSTPDERMLIVKYHGDLTIEDGVIVTPTTRKKGMFLFVTKRFINRGTLSMTARGAKALGQDVFITRTIDGQEHFIPARAGKGAPHVTLNFNGGVHGIKGHDGILGGGGSGAAHKGTTGTWPTSGPGGDATSYSGGPGGGGIATRATFNCESGDSFGGKGGNAYANLSGSSWHYSAGGGAGNPGGSGAVSGSRAIAFPGDVGTGGLLILFASSIKNYGVIESKGSDGGNATGSEKVITSGGGASGGGCINLCYIHTFQNEGAIDCSGGKGGNGLHLGGDGGDGSWFAVQVEVPRSIKLNRNLITLSPGQEFKLEYTTAINDLEYAVSWSAGDEEVAMVSHGLVTALNYGVTYVKVSSELDGMYDICEVHVSEKSDGYSTCYIKSDERVNLYSTSSLTHSSDKDVQSLINLKEVKDFYSKLLIADTNELDVIYSVPFGADIEQISSKMQVPFRRDRYSTAWIKPIDLDFHSRYVVPWESSMRSILRVTENSEMDIIYRLIQAPIEEVYISAIQDTYTRETRPTLNHGDRSTLITGQTLNDGECITYIDIDLTKIKHELITNNQMLRGLELVLHLAQPQSGSIEIYECLSQWNEYSITWMTPLLIGDKLLEYDVNSPTLSIDVSQIILDLIDKGRTRFNIMIKSEQFFLIRSRESELPPQLRFRYSDPDWDAFADEYDKMSKALIRVKNKEDINSIVQIIERFTLNSSVIIKKLENDLQGKAWIRSDWTYENFRSRARFKKLEIDLPSTVIIRSRKMSSDLPSTYHQPSTPQTGKVDIKWHENLSSKVGVLSERNTDDLNSKSIMLLRNMRSVVNILGEIVLESKAYIVAREGRNLHSTARISKLKNDFPSLGTILEKENIDLNSQAQLKGGSIHSRYRLRKTEDLGGRSWIRGKVGADITSRVEIHSGEDEDFYSTTIIQRSSEISFPGVGNLKQVMDISSIVELIHNSLIESYGILRQFDIFEISSYATLSSENKFYRFPSNAFIRKRVHNYFTSKAQIETTARRWIPNLHAPDIFDYENRKLPRLWIRENFIKG